MSREKGFFLLFELLIALLLFLGFYSATLAYSSPPPFSLPARVAEVGCRDLLHVWLLGEDNLSLFAGEMLPTVNVSFSPTPIFASRSNSFSCFASRFHSGASETLYILIEW